MLIDYVRRDSPYDCEITLKGEDQERPTLLDVSSFLYDINLAYEFARLATDPRYEGVHLSRYSYFRKGRPLKEADRLRVEYLRNQSPIELQTVIVGAAAALGAVWALVQIVERISNWSLNRQKLQLEIAKLRKDRGETTKGLSANASETGKVPILTEEEYLGRLDHAEAGYYLKKITNRLEDSEIQILLMEIRIIKRRNRSEDNENS
jgi:hypothetical protein